MPQRVYKHERQGDGEGEDMITVVAFLAGLFLGAFFGVLVAAVLSAGRIEDERYND